MKECLPDFIETNVLKERLGNECHQFIQHEKKKLQKIYNLTEMLRDRIGDVLSKQKE